MRFVVFPDPFDALVHARVVDMIISADTPQQAAEKSRYLGPVRVINVENVLSKRFVHERTRCKKGCS
jgi:hypothetical protein